MPTKRKQQKSAPKVSVWTRLYLLLHPAKQENECFLGGVQVVYNHLTHVVFLIIDEASGVDPKAYSDLSDHYESQGYYLQVISNQSVITAAAK